MPTTDLGDAVYAIDTMMGGHSGITASYLIAAERPCLVETGTALSAPAVVASLGELGIGAQDLEYIVVTHIHLDHAGGVGDIGRAFPKARVVVHEAGARHLVDPSRLVASAHRVFGPDMNRLFGDLLPTPEERILALGETGSVDLGGGRSLRTFHNPGHASHHVALVDSATGDLYTGDAAGVYVQQTAQVRPATPPPDFDLDVALASLARMREAGATRLLFSHFGPVTDVEETMEASEAELRLWVEVVRRARLESPEIDHAIAMVRELDRERHPDFYADAAVEGSFEALSSVQANVLGIARWLDRTETAG